MFNFSSHVVGAKLFPQSWAETKEHAKVFNGILVRVIIESECNIDICGKLKALNKFYMLLHNIHFVAIQYIDVTQ